MVLWKHQGIERHLSLNKAEFCIIHVPLIRSNI
uniref:Uncharacterized protein n=1 Tax=Arundo donax TaxID=35708 RepID=A0A0A8Y035_ARUDO